jgi:hypothetical protein
MESPPTSPGFSASASDLLNICDTPEALFDTNDKGRSGIPVSSPSSSPTAASFSSIAHSSLVSSPSTAEGIQARGPSHDLASSLANPTSSSSSTSSSPNSLSALAKFCVFPNNQLIINFFSKQKTWQIVLWRKTLVEKYFLCLRLIKRKAKK